MSTLMTRLGRRIFTSLLASAAILALALWASAATPLAAGAASCLPQGAQTLAVDRVAVVFSWRGLVYACLAATGERRKLGGAGVCNQRPGRIAPVRLVGEFAAYAVERCGVDAGTSTIVIRNLTSPRPLVELPAGTIARGPESFVLVASLVLRGGGRVGWIVVDESLVRTRRSIYEVHRFTRSRSSLLDSGSAIDPASLRLAGSRMMWRDGNGTRSASLK